MDNLSDPSNQDWLSNLLEEGEEPLWTGRPVRRRILMRLCFAFLCNGILFFGGTATMAAALLVDPRHSMSGFLIFLCLGTAFASIGFLLILIDVVRPLLRLNGIRYVLTNRRAMVVDIKWNDHLVVPDCRMGEIEFERKRDGSGTITFWPAPEAPGEGFGIFGNFLDATEIASTLDILTGLTERRHESGPDSKNAASESRKESANGDETILWKGNPSPNVTRFRSAGLILFAMAVLTFGTVWSTVLTVGLLRHGQIDIEDLILLPILLPFLVFGFAVLGFGVRLMTETFDLKHQAANTTYTVSNRKATVEVRSKCSHRVQWFGVENFGKFRIHDFGPMAYYGFCDVVYEMEPDDERRRRWVPTGFATLKFEPDARLAMEALASARELQSFNDYDSTTLFRHN